MVYKVIGQNLNVKAKILINYGVFKGTYANTDYDLQKANIFSFFESGCYQSLSSNIS